MGVGMKAKTFTLTIPGTPQAIKAGAPMARIGGGAYIKSNHSSNEEKKRIGELVREACGDDLYAHILYPFTGAIVINIDYFFEKPAHKIRKKSNPFPFPNCKPDFDNLIKVTMDGIQRANGPKRNETENVVWHDDAQVLGGHVMKHWCVEGEEPRTEVTLVEIVCLDLMELYMSMIDEAKEVLIGGVA